MGLGQKHLVNGLYLYSTCSSLFNFSKHFYNTSQQSPIHTHNHNLRADGFSTKNQPAYQELIHTHSHSNGPAIWSNSGFGVLPKETSTCGPEKPGTKPPTFWLVDNLLYLLSHSLPIWDYKWTANGLYLYSTSLVIQLLKALLHKSAITHSHNNCKVAPLQRGNLLIRKSYIQIHTPMEQPSGAIRGSKTLGHVD